jgi:Fe-Mn family superoxide dismutase
MKFELPQLNYSPDALAPHISLETIDYHHGKHHQAYVNNLNGLIPGTPFEDATLEMMIRKADGGIYNNAAQVWNHTFYFAAFSPSGRREPHGTLSHAFEAEFGSFAAFTDSFTKSATALFGSGWTWLSMKPDGRLTVTQEPNAGNPIRSGLVPLMTCDVWEHAYYIDYRNRRADYIKSFWELLDWNIIGERYDEALKK